METRPIEPFLAVNHGSSRNSGQFLSAGDASSIEPIQAIPNAKPLFVNCQQFFFFGASGRRQSRLSLLT